MKFFPAPGDNLMRVQSSSARINIYCYFPRHPKRDFNFLSLFEFVCCLRSSSSDQPSVPVPFAFPLKYFSSFFSFVEASSAKFLWHLIRFIIHFNFQIFSNLIVFSYIFPPRSPIFFSFRIYLSTFSQYRFLTILKTKLSFLLPRSNLLSQACSECWRFPRARNVSIGISFETILSKLFLHRRVLSASSVSRSSTLRAVQPRLLREPRSRRVSEITLPTVEEGPSLACTSLPPASRGHYCSTQHLHLGFFFRVTCSICDASPGPCAVILATSTVAVLDDAATWSIDRNISS